MGHRTGAFVFGLVIAAALSACGGQATSPGGAGDGNNDNGEGAGPGNGNGNGDDGDPGSGGGGGDACSCGNGTCDPAESCEVCASDCGECTFANTLHVPADHASIQAAIDAASEGDLVLVAPGTYNENVVLDKTITLASEYLTTGDVAKVAATVIDGGGSGAVIEVGDAVGPETTIYGFTVQNGDDGIAPNKYVRIYRNRVTQTEDGTDWQDASGVIAQNVFFGNGDDGVDLDGSSSAIVEGNIIRDNDNDGIEIRFHPHDGATLDIVIRNNMISGNAEDGVQLIEDGGTKRHVVISRNLIFDNAMAGLGVMDGGDTNEDYRAAQIPDPIWVINNTITGHTHGISGGAKLVSVNNIVTESDTLGVKGASGKVAFTLLFGNGMDTADSAMDAASIVSGDPKLEGDLYELGEGSAALDVGTASFDFDGESVLALPESAYEGAAPDLGWLEQGSEACVSPLSD